MCSESKWLHLFYFVEQLPGVGGLWSTEGSERSPSKTWVRVCDEEPNNGQEWYSSITHEGPRADT